MTLSSLVPVIPPAGGGGGGGGVDPATLGLLAYEDVVSSSFIADGSIVDADVAPSAAIATTKLSPNPLTRASHTGTQASSTITPDPLARSNHTGTQLAATISDLAAALVPFTPTGSIAATNVQAALAEVASEASAGVTVTSVDGRTGDVTLADRYVDVGGDTMTGALIVTGGLLEARAALAARLAAGAQLLLQDAAGATIGKIATSGGRLAIGQGAMAPATATGMRALALGDSALAANPIGPENTAVGCNAGQNILGGGNNTVVGSTALNQCTSGNDNTAVGVYALRFDINGGTNTAIGSSAATNNTSGDNNTAVGFSALSNNQSGRQNTAIGDRALSGPSATSKNFNTALGFFAGFQAGSGQNNVFVGHQAAYSPNGNSANMTTSASSQTCIGTGTGQSGATPVDRIVCLGENAIAGGAGAMALGAGTVAGHAGGVAIGRDSSGAAASTSAADQMVFGTAAHTYSFPGAFPASQVDFTPTGTIAATNVQAAIAEVAAEAGSSITPDPGWAVTPGYTQDKTINPESTTVTELARNFGTLVDVLKAKSILA